MRSRLTFPSAGMETKYVWDRHTLQNNGIYKWDKHNIVNQTKYYWDKYGVNKEIKYYWEKHTINYEELYKWHRYPLTATTEPVWNQWLLSDDEYDNINLVFENEYELDTFDTEMSKTGYLILYGVDNEGNYYNKVLNVSELLTNGIVLWEIVYSQLWFGASFANSLNDIDYENPEFLGYCNISKAKYQNEYYLTIIGYRITSGNFSYAYRGEPVSNIQYQTTHSYDKRKKLLQQTSTAPNGENTYHFYGNSSAKDASGETIRVTQELQNSKYTTIEDQAVGYLIDFDNYEVLTSTNPDRYPNDLLLGPNFNSSDYYYEPQGVASVPIKGDYVETIISSDDTAFPTNGEQGGYWYVATSSPSYYLWDKYEVVEKPTWSVYKATPEMAVEVEIGVQSNYNSFSIASDTDLGEPERIYPDYLTLNDLSGNEIITLYGKNECCQLYTTFDEVDMTVEEFAELLTHIPYEVEDYPSYHISWIRTSPIVYIPAFSIRGNTYVFNPLNNSSVLFKVEQNNDNTYKFEADASLGLYCFHCDKALSKEKNTILYGTYTDYDPPNKQYIYRDILIDMPVLGDARYGNVLRPKYDKYYASTNFEIVNNLLINKEYNLPFKILGEDGDYFYKIKNNTEPQLIDGDYYNSGVLLETITDVDTEAYPQDGYKDGYWYVYEGIKSHRGNFIGTIKSEVSNTYPDGIQGSYWYDYRGYAPYEDITKAGYIGEIESLNKDDYPVDSYQGQYWYVYKGSKLFQYIGSFIETIYAEKINDYPHYGIKGSYWYDYKGFEDDGPYKSRWVDQVETNTPDSYPQDGIQGSYWYVFNKEYEGFKLQINDPQIRGGVSYKQNINPEADYVIGCVSSAEIGFKYDNSYDDFDKYLEQDYCDYYTWQPNDIDWRLIGRFWIDEAKYENRSVQVKAFDSILASDVYVDDFIENTTFPITLNDFFNSLCEFLGVVGIVDSSAANLNYAFQDNFEAINITARQLLQYIAEMAGGFIKSDTSGRIHLTTYSPSGLELNNSNYTSYSRQRYEVQPISGLTVKMNTDDLGVSSGDAETNPYIIENNPLFYTQSDEEINPVVDELYSNINDKVYRPATIELLQDFDINTGDIITINGDTFYVMSKELSASGCKLECFGNQYREKKASSINSDIVALRGKTNELFRDLDTTKSTITDTANGLQSQITQTVDSINTRITDEVNGLESTITQTSTEISTRITNEVDGLESKITQTADSLTSTITDEVNEAKSEIKQTTDSINLQLDSQGELVAQLRLDLDGIALRGYVTFTDLAGSGTTTINGDNITTGTINADRINMTGAISWGDLDNNCKNTIASFAGSDADVPDYIKSTYIDATKIVSPTIQGGTLSAGTTAEGYMRMSSSGMNFVSNTSGNLMGIGFYPGKYNYPYIIFGDGVDSQGTDRGMIKKYTEGIWIGDSDGQASDMASGTGIFISFTQNKIYKYINGQASQI